MNKIEQCPICKNETVKDRTNGKYFCSTCNQFFSKIALCDKCGEEVQKLSTCAATNYFCNHCKDLKSTKKLKFLLK